MSFACKNVACLKISECACLCNIHYCANKLVDAGWTHYIFYSFLNVYFLIGNVSNVLRTLSEAKLNHPDLAPRFPHYGLLLLFLRTEIFLFLCSQTTSDNVSVVATLLIYLTVVLIVFCLYVFWLQILGSWVVWNVCWRAVALLVELHNLDIGEGMAYRLCFH